FELVLDELVLDGPRIGLERPSVRALDRLRIGVRTALVAGQNRLGGGSTRWRERYPRARRVELAILASRLSIRGSSCCTIGSGAGAAASSASRVAMRASSSGTVACGAATPALGTPAPFSP